MHGIYGDKWIEVIASCKTCLKKKLGITVTAPTRNHYSLTNAIWIMKGTAWLANRNFAHYIWHLLCSLHDIVMYIRKRLFITTFNHIHFHLRRNFHNLAKDVKREEEEGVEAEVEDTVVKLTHKLTDERSCWHTVYMYFWIFVNFDGNTIQ